MVIAEQFGTLATLYPGRIDLGLGRAPGTDRLTMRALRRHLDSADEAESFPRDVVELQAYLGPPQPGQPVRAIPGEGTEVPIWILGSSLYSAQLAAHLGLPYAFASHFAPDLLLQALQVYRAGFRPSAQWPKPHAMVGVNVVCADSDERGGAAVHVDPAALSGHAARAPRPAAAADRSGAARGDVVAGREVQVERMLAASAVGSPSSVRNLLGSLLEQTEADELIVAGAIHDPAARLRSYELLAEIWR